MSEEKLKFKKLFIWIIAGVLLFVAFEAFIAPGKGVRLEPGRPRLLEFYSNNCPACEMMKPIMDEIYKECGRGDLEISYVNVKNPQVMMMAMKFKVFGVPTFIFLDRDGKEIERLVGPQPKMKIKQAINKLTNGQCGT